MDFLSWQHMVAAISNRLGSSPLLHREINPGQHGMHGLVITVPSNTHSRIILEL